jgi:hypothetical protein
MIRIRESLRLGRFSRYRRRVDYHKFVSACYETVLGRKADEAGLNDYVNQLKSGSIDAVGLLQALRSSDEFRAGEICRVLESDQFVQRFLTDSVIRLSETLEAERPIGREEYDRHFDSIFGESAGPLIIGQKEYGAVHRNRFYELVNALHIFGAPKDQAALLEFGASEFSALYRKFFPDLTVDIADRPVPEDYIGFTRKVVLDRLNARNFYSIDLNQPSLFPGYTDTLPRYSLILFCEVLEHLLVNPIEVLTFLVSLLEENGLIYLTTPNFFSYKNLEKMKSGENPQEIYPVMNENWDAHFHHREFSLKELLGFTESCRGVVKAFYISACWDYQSEVLYRDRAMRGNLVLVIGRQSRDKAQPGMK